MKIAVVTTGSRGDVQPYLAVGLGLRRAGHDAYLVAPSNFARLAAEYGMPLRPLSCDFQKVLRQEDYQRTLESGRLLSFARFLRRRPMNIDCVNREVWRLTGDAEALLYKAGSPSACYSIARWRNIPAVGMTYAPAEPTREFSMVAPGERPRGPLYNRLSSGLLFHVMWFFASGAANRFRREVLQMPRISRWRPPRESLQQPLFCAFSPTVVPKPADWGENSHVIGYCFLGEPPGWKPPADLCRFLESGPKPVCVTFGSMTNSSARQRALALAEGIRRNGQRAILQRGWGELGDDMALADDVFVASEVPHRWLFPRVRMVVHHGGAGTTAEAFRSGVPSIVVPHNFDQPFWAQRALMLGVAPPPIPIRRLSADRLATAVRNVLDDESLQHRAAELGTKIRAEDGVARAVEAFLDYAARTRGDKPPKPPSWRAA